MHKAIFLDRDGVINEDDGYVGSVERFKFLPKVPWALKNLKHMGYLTILVTNQSGIARGLYTVDDFNQVSQYMQAELQEAAFDGIYFCPHHPQALLTEFRCDCQCRKPKGQMFLWAKQEHDIDFSQSIMIGDHASDLIAAKSVNIPKLVLVGKHIATESKLIVEAQCFNDLPSFVSAMMNDSIEWR